MDVDVDVDGGRMGTGCGRSIFLKEPQALSKESETCVWMAERCCYCCGLGTCCTGLDWTAGW